MKKAAHWIEDAITVIDNVEIPDPKTKEVDSEFKGYFASFGASIIQSGALPTAIFFENEESNPSAARTKVPKAILLLLQMKYPEDASLKTAKLLSGYLRNNNSNGDKNDNKTPKIITATVALKMALRTYKIKTKKSNEK